MKILLLMGHLERSKAIERTLLDVTFAHQPVEVVRAHSLCECELLLRANHPDLILAGLDIGDAPGAESWRRLHILFPFAPRLMVSRSFEEESLLAAAGVMPHQWIREESLTGGDTLKLIRGAQDKAQLEFRLEEAMNLVQKSRRGKTDFTHWFVGEVRPAVNAILSMVGIVQGTELNQEQKDYLLGIKQNAESLMKFTFHVLDYTRIEAGQLELDRVVFDLRSVFDDLMDSFREAANIKQLTFFNYTDPNIPHLIRGDAERIRQVLAALIGNSLRYTKKGFVILNATVIRENQIKIKVQDSGQGMDPELLKRMLQEDPSDFLPSGFSFEPDVGRKGFGLKIARVLIEHMGGQIHFHTTPGEGCEFTLEIPVEFVKKQPDVPTRANLENRTAVLFFENQTVGNIVNNIFVHRGFYTELYFKMESFLRSVKSNPNVDLVMFDLLDSERNIEFFESVQKNLPANSHARIIYFDFSTHSDRNYRASPPPSGGIRLSKTISHRKILSWSAHALGNPIPNTHVAHMESGEKGESKQAELSGALTEGKRSRKGRPHRHVWRSGLLFEIPLLDTAHLMYLQGLSENDDEIHILGDLVDTFVSTQSRLLEDFRKTWEKNPVEAKSISHKMRGAALNIGARRLEKICQRIEKLLHQAPERMTDKYLHILDVVTQKTMWELINHWK